MSEVHHFAFGPLTPVLAYVMSCIGSFLGLLCTTRGRTQQGRRRAGWLTLGAVSIGGTGIWVMHFVAMLGFRVPGMEIRYDLLVTLASAALAMIVVGIGLAIVAFGGMRPPALIAGGMFTGLGVAGMHYLGMHGIRLPGHISYDMALVVLSFAIAIVTATAALWFVARVSGPWATMGAALVMGVAVSGMHYTGMAGMHVHADPGLGRPEGASAFDFLLPLTVGITFLAMLLLMAVGFSTGDDDPRPAGTSGGLAAGRRDEPARTPGTSSATESGAHRAGRWFDGSAD